MLWMAVCLIVSLQDAPAKKWIITIRMLLFCEAIEVGYVQDEE